MSDFHPKSFKMAFILSLLIENTKPGTYRNLKDGLKDLRHYAEQKYKADGMIESKFLDYYSGTNDSVFEILTKLFGEP